MNNKEKKLNFIRDLGYTMVTRGQMNVLNEIYENNLPLNVILKKNNVSIFEFYTWQKDHKPFKKALEVVNLYRYNNIINILNNLLKKSICNDEKKELIKILLREYNKNNKKC